MWNMQQIIVLTCINITEAFGYLFYHKLWLRFYIFITKVSCIWNTHQIKLDKLLLAFRKLMWKANDYWWYRGKDSTVANSAATYWTILQYATVPPPAGQRRGITLQNETVTTFIVIIYYWQLQCWKDEQIRADNYSNFCVEKWNMLDWQCLAGRVDHLQQHGTADTDEEVKPPFISQQRVPDAHHVCDTHLSP